MKKALILLSTLLITSLQATENHSLAFTRECLEQIATMRNLTQQLAHANQQLQALQTRIAELESSQHVNAHVETQTVAHTDAYTPCNTTDFELFSTHFVRNLLAKGKKTAIKTRQRRMLKNLNQEIKSMRGCVESRLVKENPDFAAKIIQENMLRIAPATADYFKHCMSNNAEEMGYADYLVENKLNIFLEILESNTSDPQRTMLKGINTVFTGKRLEYKELLHKLKTLNIPSESAQAGASVITPKIPQGGLDGTTRETLNTIRTSATQAAQAIEQQAEEISKITKNSPNGIITEYHGLLISETFNSLVNNIDRIFDADVESSDGIVVHLQAHTVLSSYMTKFQAKLLQQEIAQADAATQEECDTQDAAE